MQYIWLPKDLAQSVFPVLVRPYKHRDRHLPVYVSNPPAKDVNERTRAPALGGALGSRPLGVKPRGPAKTRAEV